MWRVRRRLLGAALLLAGLAPGAAGALEFVPVAEGPLRVVLAQGAVEAGDAQALARTLDRLGRVDEVWLNSGGGDAEEGYRIGETIRGRGLATRVPAARRLPEGARVRRDGRAICASACVYAFLGGIVRQTDCTECVGVHLATLAHPRNIALITRAIQQGAAVPVLRQIEKSAIADVATEAEFLARMGVSIGMMHLSAHTPAACMTWLSQTDMRRFNVVNAGGEAGTTGDRASPRCCPDSPAPCP